MRPALAWLAGFALVVAAGVVTAVAPTEDAAQAPFAVPMALGERAEGRDIAATVDEVRLADRVEADGWYAEGTWLVVDLEAEAVRSEQASLLQRATLEVDGRSYSASERPDSLAGRPLSVGLPTSGSLAFELPPDAAGPAVLRLGRALDDRLDSVLELPIDLDALRAVPVAELRETGWTP